MFTASRPPVPPRWADVRRLRLCPHRVTPPGLSADKSCTTKSQVDDDSCQPIGIRPAFLQAAACPPPRRPRRAHARPEQGAHDAAGAAAAPHRGHSGKRGHAEGDGAEASGADPGGNLHKSEMARNTTLGGGRLCRHRWGACRGGSNFLSDAPPPPPAGVCPAAGASAHGAGWQDRGRIRQVNTGEGYGPQNRRGAGGGLALLEGWGLLHLCGGPRAGKEDTAVWRVRSCSRPLRVLLGPISGRSAVAHETKE